MVLANKQQPLPPGEAIKGSTAANSQDIRTHSSRMSLMVINTTGLTPDYYYFKI